MKTLGLLVVTTLLLLLSYLPLHSCSSVSVTRLFEAWCDEHGKTYSSVEKKQRRLEIFEDNYAFVTKHNEICNSSYSLSLNAFADLTHHEFKASHLGLRLAATPTVTNSSRRNAGDPDYVVRDIPASIDWSEKGAVTEPKDQGRCDASWAFAATGAMEGINQIVTGSLVGLSEQELIDCGHSSSDGCEGGIVDHAYQFVIDNHGIDTDDEYPYREREWECSKPFMERRIVTIDGYKDVPANKETLLLQAVATQPVSAAICASDRAFQFYHIGIFTGPCCSSLNHAVLIVGYDSLDGVDYWIVKNSWGSWGMRGYMLLLRDSRNPEGICGINMLASYPTKTSPNPPRPTPPGPPICYLLHYCPEDTFCCCTWTFLDFFCIAWSCCAYRPAVCDTKTNMCLQHAGNSTAEALIKRKSSWKFGGWTSFAKE